MYAETYRNMFEKYVCTSYPKEHVFYNRSFFHFCIKKYRKTRADTERFYITSVYSMNLCKDVHKLYEIPHIDNMQGQYTPNGNIHILTNISKK